MSDTDGTDQAKGADEASADKEAKADAEVKAGGEAKAADTSKPDDAAKSADESKAADAAKAADKLDGAGGAKPADEPKADEAAKTTDEVKAADAAKGADEVEDAGEAKPADEVKPDEEAEPKAADEVKAADEPKADEEVKAVKEADKARRPKRPREPRETRGAREANGAGAGDGVGAGAAKFGLSETRIFTDLAMERGYVSQAQVSECLDIREKIRAMGLDEKLADILVKKGYLAEADARRLERALSGYRRLGNFEIVARIGQGSMGTVFKARQISMDRYVAVKILPPRLARDVSYVDRFLREARAVAKLNHVNIVQGIDVGEAGGYYYFAMEYVEGVTVRETLKSKGPYAEKATLEIIVQMARALEHAARAGLIHRDIKPDNIIVTPAGVAKLLDLGIAKAAGAEGEEGVRVGTPYYISPEQARGDADVDTRSDIYSLGATFYHMVVGSPPFSGSTAEEVIRAHLIATVPNPREVRPGLSRNVSRVIEMMMAREPEDRYQTAAELLVDLDKVASGRAPGKAKTFHAASSVALGPETATTSKTSPLPPVRRAPRRSNMIFAASGIAATLIMVIAVLVAMNVSRPDPRAAAAQAALQQALADIARRPQDLEANIRQLERLASELSGTGAYGPCLAKLEELRGELLARQQPPVLPGNDPKTLAAREMLKYALEEIAKHPQNLEANIALLEKVAADTRGTAVHLEAMEKLGPLKNELNALIQKSWDAAWAAAEVKAREHRFAEAAAVLAAGFPAGYRERYVPWAGKHQAALKDFENRAALWLDGEEKRAADLVAKHEFDKAREALKGLAVAGGEGVNKRIITGLVRIDKAEDEHKKLLADQKAKQEEELRRQRGLAYLNFLRELYGKRAARGFKEAENYCREAASKPENAVARADLEQELKDVGAMREAAAALVESLAALRGSFRFTYSRQPMVAHVVSRDANDPEKVWLSPGEGAQFPVTLSELVPVEIVELTAFGKGSTEAAMRACLYLTWRAEYPAARKCLEEAGAGDAPARALRRLDILEKGMAEFYAEELVRRARAEHAAGKAAEFLAALAELRAKYAGTKAYAGTRQELEAFELEQALAGLEPAALALGHIRPMPGGMLAFGYDFNVESPQVLDWQSTGDMWRWGQTIFDRNGVDVFLSDDGQLLIRPDNDRRIAANWAVPVGRFVSVEFEVAWLNGRGSLGAGLAKPDLFAKDNNLRAWFPENGKPYIRQGDQRKQAAEDVRLEKDRKYRIRLEFAGNEVRLLLDGRELVRDALRFDPAGSRVALGSWATEAAFDNLQIVGKPEDGWLRRRADLAAKLRQAGLKPGLNVEYFADKDFKKSALKRVEQGACYWWNTRAPAPGVPADNFSARLAGKLYVEKPGHYRVFLRPDDHGRLFIDGKKLIDDNFSANPSAELDLSPGWHDLAMEVIETGGFAGIEMSWETNGVPRQVVPFELLGH